MSTLSDNRESQSVLLTISAARSKSAWLYCRNFLLDLEQVWWGFTTIINERWRPRWSEFASGGIVLQNESREGEERSIRVLELEIRVGSVTTWVKEKLLMTDNNLREWALQGWFQGRQEKADSHSLYLYQHNLHFSHWSDYLSCVHADL